MSYKNLHELSCTFFELGSEKKKKKVFQIACYHISALCIRSPGQVVMYKKGPSKQCEEKLSEKRLKLFYEKS